HEKYIAPVKQAMVQYKDDDRVDGLLFKYLHFYGSYDYLGNSSNWYRHEIRVIRNKKNIYSYRDAQGFRKNDNEKLDVKLIDAYIYHYGWVREPGAMQAKFNHFGKYWLGDEWSEMAEKTFAGEFDYTQVDSVEKFTGTHPAVMKERITRMNWKFERDLSYNKLKPKEKFKRLVEKLTGRRPFEYKNYRVI
ncbi:MAG: glycosyl transferase, partial [Chitinophagaceae bacterium]|nr:glycosyl transferase [Chitinophagaceae bacterium]